MFSKLEATTVQCFCVFSKLEASKNVKSVLFFCVFEAQRVKSAVFCVFSKFEAAKNTCFFVCFRSSVLLDASNVKCFCVFSKPDAAKNNVFACFRSSVFEVFLNVIVLLHVFLNVFEFV